MSCYSEIPSPIGKIKIIGDREAVSAIILEGDQRFLDCTTDLKKDVTELRYIGQALSAYLSGESCQFDIPLAPSTGTTFQKQVWKALQSIPPGTTASYRDIAEQLDNPKAVRAVGAANGKNPIAIVVPCHRVIGANGTLTGYAGGIDAKRWLLAHEARHFRADKT